VWVIDKLEHRLIFERIYYKAVGLKLEEMNNRLCSVTIFTFNKIEIMRWQAVSAKARRNQSRDNLLSKHALNS
jgi:hypothetical protein